MPLAPVLLPILVAAGGGGSGRAFVARQADRLRALYAPVGEVTVETEVRASVGPTCPVEPEGGGDCEALRHEAPLVTARLRPDDQRVFAPLTVAVFAPPPGLTGAGYVRRAVAAGAVAGGGGEVLIGLPDAVAALRVPCAAAGLRAYEAADLLAALSTGDAADGDAADGDAADVAVAWSTCGASRFALHDGAWLRAMGERPTEAWGLPFPEIRERRRRLAAEPPP